MALATMAPAGGSFRRSFTAESAGLQRGYGVTQGAADGGVAAIAAANTRIKGVLNRPTVNVGDPANVTTLGEEIAIAGAAITAGQLVTTDNTGRFVPIAGAAGSGREIAGEARSSQPTVGGEFVIFVSPSIS
jgi:hypothetical protein